MVRGSGKLVGKAVDTGEGRIFRVGMCGWGQVVEAWRGVQQMRFPGDVLEQR